ncbi:hypothetical protein [Catellatospora tritici]|uniref:hypothetical protein n=1 Tax=Catellatospora tritici TaxID=2851566 RepID=UPI001C2DBA94|nr:hypothetical protein [Catellatospora tritici]MBV1850763.1 hypothetical protein [Catellatospora tritici]MBV1851016.1 hypothetical protein [Catellatospora tritici]
MQDLLINLLASVIAGAAVWFAQRLVRYRSVERRRRFFGIRPNEEVHFHVSRHFSSPREKSVHRDDMAALVELAIVTKECGGRPTLVTAVDTAAASRTGTEFCVGGPAANERTAAYLRSLLPGVAFDIVDSAQMSIRVGGRTFDHTPGRAEYALVVRLLGQKTGHPVFLLMGQKAYTNLAAARYLATQHRELGRRFPDQRDFCLLLLVREPAVLGSDHVELVADLTAEAATAPVAAPAVTGDADDHTAQR